MSTIRNPVGPQPKGVYWRRRILVLLGLVAIIVVIVLIVNGRGSASPESDAGSKTSSPPASSGATTPPAASGTCDPKDIELLANTDADSYPAGVNPNLWLTITNIGTEPCSYNVGTSQQDYTITSGTETIWKWSDCATDRTDGIVTLQPADPQHTTAFAWDRTRSTPDTCAVADKPQVTAGGASYHLTVSMGDITSPDTKQFLLY